MYLDSVFVRINDNRDIVGCIRHISQPVIKVGSSYVDLTVERKVKIRELI